MKVIFLIGGTASGKSLVASQLEELGVERVDLDQVSRAVLDGEPQCVNQLVEAFGPEILEDSSAWLSAEGLEYCPAVNRQALASRAFGSPEDTQLLESIEMPYIKARLADLLTPVSCAAPGPETLVVEVPLPDRLEDLWSLADEVLYVRAPLKRRRQLAWARGMDPADFDHRIAYQPTDQWCLSHATSVIENLGTSQELRNVTVQWYERWRADSDKLSTLT